MDLHRRDPLRRVTVALLALVVTAAGCSEERQPAAAFSPIEQALGEQFTLRTGGSFGTENTRLRNAAEGSVDQALQVTFPAGTASGRADSKAPRGGAQAYLRFREGPQESLHLRYLIRFPKGFQFVKGGKLPGLYGGSATSGGDIPDGENGFSTRYMWRKEGAGEVYAYLPTSRNNGTSLGRGNWTWPTDRWVCVEQAVQLNDPGQEDGVVQVWLDDRLVLTERGLVFRSTDELEIEGVFFSTFFGGSDKSWATPITQQVEFADFEVGSERLGCT